MARKFDYAPKFESHRNKTLYERLDLGAQRFIRTLSFKYRFSFQEFRQVVEASRDLSMWGERGLEAWWQSETSQVNKKELLEKLQDYLKTLRAAPTLYPKKGLARPKKRRTPKIITKQSDKKIEGLCPVASPKTVCCNLRTIDAVETCALGCSYCSIQTFYDGQAVFDADFGKKLKGITIEPDRFYHYGTGQSSDSLLWGNQNGSLDALCQLALDHPNILLEFKTKSKNIRYFLENAIPANVVCSWSLNTSTIIDNEEHFAASLEERLAAARQLADRGIPVAFHFHPIVYYEGWEDEYADLAFQCMKRFQPDEVSFISFGTITFIKPVIQKIRELGNPTKIFQMDLVSDPHGKLTYPDDIKIKMYQKIYHALKPWQGYVFMYLCMEKPSIWKQVFGYLYESNEAFERDFGLKTHPFSISL